jgi:hypothetical protein
MTIFGHVAMLISRKEDVATTALHYLLTRYQQASTTMTGIVQVPNANPALANLTWHLWPSSRFGEGRPDLAGRHNGQNLVFIENKLGAGLTSHQPASYIERLPVDGVLLFIMPQQRITFFPAELDARLSGMRDPAGQPVYTGSPWSRGGGNGAVVWREVNKTGVTDRKFLAITSWQSLLDQLSSTFGGSPPSDIVQFRGFISEATGGAKFVSFTAEQLSSSEIPSLIGSVQFVVDQAWDKADSQQLFTNVEPKVTPDEYGRYAACNGFGIWFGLYLQTWRRFGVSPAWISVNHDTARDPERLFQALSAITPAGTEPRTMPSEPNWYIPVFIPAQQGADSVVECVLDQLRGLKNALDAIP